MLHVNAGEGAIVGEIKPNSPAEKAGLKTQDVILDFNGQKVDGPSDLAGAVERMEVGKTYPMTVVRDGKRMTVPVTVQEMPSHYTSLSREESEEGNSENNAKPAGPMSFEELGIEVKELTPQIAQQLETQGCQGSRRRQCEVGQHG